MQPVGDFVRDLGLARVGPEVFNPWGQYDPEMDPWSDPAPMMRRERLAAHLSIYPALILVGEAPGYQGCRYSGVPFTSERLIIEGDIPRVSEIQHWPEVVVEGKTYPAEYERITRRERPWSEPSATIVWKQLHALNLHEVTVCWNAFPFHPHRPNEPLSNRTPTTSDLEIGRQWLRRFLDLPNLRNAAVLPVGQKAVQALCAVDMRINPALWLRHPANGGARKFAEGLAAYARNIEDRRFGQPHYGH